MSIEDGTIAPMTVVRRRGGLGRTRRRLREGALTVGFLGGSITDARPGHNWPEPVIAWLIERFPGVRLTVENAAIGATGSDLAAFRARRDVIERGCDLVFVEYAVNDIGESPAKRLRSREGVLRQLLAGAGRDVVLAYTYCQEMYADMAHGRVPPSVAEFERLAAHYKLPSVWMGLHALRDVEAGRMRWEEWLPDGLHPQARGSLSYARSMIGFLARELVEAPGGDDIPTGERRPAPLDPRNWEALALVPFAVVRLEGPWTVRRWPHLVWIDQVLATAAVGARLSFAFEGRGLALGFDFGRTSSEFRYRLDGGEWVDTVRDRPAWVGDSGWYRLTLIADDLAPGRHAFEMEVTHGDRPDCTGTNCHLALIGLIR